MSSLLVEQASNFVSRLEQGATGAITSLGALSQTLEYAQSNKLLDAATWEAIHAELLAKVDPNNPNAERHPLLKYDPAVLLQAASTILGLIMYLSENKVVDQVNPILAGPAI